MRPLAWILLGYLVVAAGGQSLLQPVPAPGKVVDSTFDAKLGVTSAWLSNGVRVHHRFMDAQRDTILVHFTLAGGQIEETAENAGVTAAAGAIFGWPATSLLPPAEFEKLRQAHRVFITGRAADDTFGFQMTTVPESLEMGLRLAHDLIVDAHLDGDALARWRQRELEKHAQNETSVVYHFQAALWDLLSGSDPRRPVVTRAKLEAPTREQAQAWLTRLCSSAPLEVAIVGDVKWNYAQPLVEKYLASLPSRPREATHLAELRRWKRPAGPLERRVEYSTDAPHAVALYGFIGADGRDHRDAYALEVAVQVLRKRVTQRLRAELGWAMTTAVMFQWNAAYAESGVFQASIPCKPEHADGVRAELKRLFDEFAREGPTDDEVAAGRRQVAETQIAGMRNVGFWIDRLRTLTLHRVRLADLARAPDIIGQLTAEDVRNVFRQYYVPERTIQVTVVPRPATTAPAEGD